MKDKHRRVAVFLTVLATLVINGLSNRLPITGQNTGGNTDRVQIYFISAGCVVSIWILIYPGLIT